MWFSSGRITKYKVLVCGILAIIRIRLKLLMYVLMSDLAKHTLMYLV